MNTFNKIVAMAAFAYTADAAGIRARCRIENSAGESQGFFVMKQDALDDGSYGNATVNFGVRDLDAETAHTMVILTNDGGECLTADTSSPLEILYEGQSSRWGHIGQRDLAADGLEISAEMYDGQYAALLEEGIPVACCQLEVKECNRPVPPQ